MDLLLLGRVLDAETLRPLLAPLAGLPVLHQAPDAIRIRGGAQQPAVLEQVRELAARVGVDACAVPPGLKASDFSVLASDMDSTLVTIECIDELADIAGRKAEVSAITEATMRGEITDFSESLRRRVRALTGLEVSALQRVWDERLKLSPGAAGIGALVARHGWHGVVLSGGFTFFTERLVARLGLHASRANVLAIADGRLTGEVVGPIVDGAGKANAVAEACIARGVPDQAAIVLGDGSNDIPMMKVAGLSVAFRAKPKVKREATVSFDFAPLDALEHLFDPQG